MSEVAFRSKGEVEEDGCDDAAGNEEGFETVGTDVGDVGDGLARFHGWVLGLGYDRPADEHS